MLPDSTLARRLFFGTIMTVAMAAALVADGYLSCRDYFLLPPSARGLGFCLIALFFIAGGCRELYRIAGHRGHRPSLPLMIVLSIALAAHPLWRGWLAGPSSACLPGVMMAGLFLAALAHIPRGAPGAVGSLAITCLSAVYLGLGGWFVMAIRLLGADSLTTWGQIAALAMFLACVKSTDIGAYLIGRACGRRKLIPSISPAKTWEGSIGGLLVAVTVASLFSALSGIISIGFSVAFGTVVALAGQFGDLLESMLKRDAGLKDSARLVPEFGGMLDLLDSVVTSAPPAYLLFLLSRRA